MEAPPCRRKTDENPYRVGIESTCPGLMRRELMRLACLILATLTPCRWAMVQRLSPRPTLYFLP
jgi:hypothetical protein